MMAACTSTIRLQVERTPTLDTRGVRRIAIVPFTSTTSHSIGRDIAQHSTLTATNRIQALNYFTFVDNNVINQLRRRNENIEGHVDAMFNGVVTNITSQDSYSERQVTDRKTGDTYTVSTYTREVVVEFNYYLTRARDGSIIGPVYKRGNQRVSSDRSSGLTAVSDMARSIVENQMRYIGRDVAPYTVTETRRLASDTSKNKEIKDLMKSADAQVKAGNYRIALDHYLVIYANHKSMAAAQNSVILMEALGNVREAASFIQTVYGETGNPMAQRELARLNRILADQAMIADEFGDARTTVERVAVYASEETRKVLPRNAKVWIVNNASNNNMVTAVIDNLTADFIRRGVGVVDRDNAILIATEQSFQTSGMVSDSDIARIGNAAGASHIVVIGITGTGATRRLQLSVLDIERGVPILQSDTSEAWRL